MIGLDAAQRQYDRMSPDDDMTKEKREFQHPADTEQFMHDFAMTEEDAVMWLEDQGVRSFNHDEVDQLQTDCLLTIFTGSSCLIESFEKNIRDMAEQAYYAEDTQ